MGAAKIRPMDRGCDGGQEHVEMMKRRLLEQSYRRRLIEKRAKGAGYSVLNRAKVIMQLHCLSRDVSVMNNDPERAST